jgi:hypothetical protein
MGQRVSSHDEMISHYDKQGRITNCTTDGNKTRCNFSYHTSPTEQFELTYDETSANVRNLNTGRLSDIVTIANDKTCNDCHQEIDEYVQSHKSYGPVVARSRIACELSFCTSDSYEMKFIYSTLIFALVIVGLWFWKNTSKRPTNAMVYIKIVSIIYIAWFVYYLNTHCRSFHSVLPF